MAMDELGDFLRELGDIYMSMETQIQAAVKTQFKEIKMMVTDHNGSDITGSSFLMRKTTSKMRQDIAEQASDMMQRSMSNKFTAQETLALESDFKEVLELWEEHLET